MNLPMRLLSVVAAWTVGAAAIGWLLFTYLYVEHGTVVLWLAGIAAGFILGLVHVLALLERQRRVDKTP